MRVLQSINSSQVPFTRTAAAEAESSLEGFTGFAVDALKDDHAENGPSQGRYLALID
jgi:hypothetical protein